MAGRLGGGPAAVDLEISVRVAIRSTAALSPGGDESDFRDGRLRCALGRTAAPHGPMNPVQNVRPSALSETHTSRCGIAKTHQRDRGPQAHTHDASDHT